jgi:hypothetical protein
MAIKFNVKHIIIKHYQVCQYQAKPL